MITAGLADPEGDAAARVRGKNPPIRVGFEKEPRAAADGRTDHADLPATSTAGFARQEVTRKRGTVQIR
jgi:hypothetical protein